MFLRLFPVAVLWLHDWVPVGRLNDVPAVRKADGTARLAWTIVIQATPFTVGLVATVVFLRVGHPAWVWIRYALLLIGEMRAWWWPYLVRPDPARSARYAVLFGRTHAVLPMRNGMVPNTLPVVLHAATAATLLLLALPRLET